MYNGNGRLLILLFFFFPAAPSASTNLKFYTSSTSPISLSVQFDEPEANGSPILYYEVQYALVGVRDIGIKVLLVLFRDS